MGVKPVWSKQLTPSLLLCQMPEGCGDAGIWLYDETRGMNLAMRAKDEREAFVEALTYYQERLTETEASLASMSSRIEAFVATFPEFHTCDCEET